MPRSPVPPPKHSAPMRDPQRFVVVVFDGVSLAIMSLAFSVFDLARYYGVLPGLDVRVVAGEPAAALTGGGLTCEVPYDLETVRTADLVIVPDWQNPAQAPPEPLLAALRTAHAGGARIAGLCSGAFVLAAAGLLDNRPATTHWALAGVLARMYPAIDVRPGQLYIDGGDVLTAGGGAAGMDLGLYLFRTQYFQAPLPPLDEADPVGETVTWALGQLDRALPVEHLARRARMSRRNFDRRFRAITGTAPATWLTHQRVLRAQQLLTSTRLPVEEVARRCGFTTAAALRPHFRRIVGVAPAAYRVSFSQLS